MRPAGRLNLAMQMAQVAPAGARSHRRPTRSPKFKRRIGHKVPGVGVFNDIRKDHIFVAVLD